MDVETLNVISYFAENLGTAGAIAAGAALWWQKWGAYATFAAYFKAKEGYEKRKLEED